MQPSDLQKVCQWAKSNHSPSEVYNAACRLLDEHAARDEEIERLRAAKRHLSERISIGQEGWNEISRERDALEREVERLRAELAERPTFKAFRLVDGQRMAATQRAEKAEAERDRLEAELAEAKRVMAAEPSPKGIEELTEAIVEILGDPDETTVEAFLSFASAEVARIAGSEMVARWQAEDLLRIAHETSNRSEAERARAEAERDALKAAIERAKAEHTDDDTGACETCSNEDPTGLHDFRVPLPRPTLVALNTTETPEKGAESHGDARNPQTQGASEARGANEAQEGSQR